MSILDKFTDAWPPDVEPLRSWWHSISEHDRFQLLRWVSRRCKTEDIEPLHVWCASDSIFVESALTSVVLDIREVIGARDSYASSRYKRGYISASCRPRRPRAAKRRRKGAALHPLPITNVDLVDLPDLALSTPSRPFETLLRFLLDMPKPASTASPTGRLSGIRERVYEPFYDARTQPVGAVGVGDATRLTRLISTIHDSVLVDVRDPTPGQLVREWAAALDDADEEAST